MLEEVRRIQRVQIQYVQVILTCLPRKSGSVQSSLTSSKCKLYSFTRVIIFKHIPNGGKWGHRPDMAISVDWDVKHQTNTPIPKYIRGIITVHGI